MNIINNIDKKANHLKNKILLSNNADLKNKKNTYYVSAYGNDNNDGKSQEYPWKSLSKVNSVINKENNEKAYICFKRGDVFRGQLIAGSNVVYTAYGNGKKPVISGSSENGAVPSKWKLVEGTENVWEFYKELIDVGSIFFNGGDSYAVKLCPNIVDGKYEYGTEKLEDRQFLSVIPADVAIGLNNSTAKNLFGKLFLCCQEGNPGEVFDSIEFAERFYAVVLPDHSKNITFDNISIKYAGAHGIGGGFIENLLVQNCEIGCIGGGIQSYNKTMDNKTYSVIRYGNGVEVHSYCNGYTVKNCWIHDIYDAGITHQQGNNHSVGLLFKDVSYIGNLIENCIYSIEYFAHKSATTDATVLMENINISNNIMRKAGCGFGAQRTMLDNGWNLGNHINGWNKCFNLTNGQFVIENNIFDRALSSEPDRPKKNNTSLILVAAGNKIWLPEFNNNKYIIEKGNQLACIGENSSQPNSYIIADENATAENVFGDTMGEIILL